MENRHLEFLEQGRAALFREGTAVTALADQLDKTFADAVEGILSCRGHVLVCGAGTSQSVAKRLAHLLTCVGAPAVALDAGEIAHGGAGAVTPDDVVIAISKGGETKDVNNLVRVAHEWGATVISLTQAGGATITEYSDIVISFEVDQAADALGLLPFGSSLAAAAIGDALCSAVLSERGYDEGFLRDIHPGGAVGKKLRRGDDS